MRRVELLIGIVTLLALATACGGTSSSARSGSGSGTGTGRADTSAFTSCLEEHGVELPDQNSQPPQGAPPSQGGQPPSGPVPGGQMSQTFRKALEACQQYAPQGGQFAPPGLTPPSSTTTNTDA